MAVGTAGLAAMLAVETVEGAGVAPGAGPVLVTGAAGGVGMVAVHLLARLGYTVTASTGRASEHGTLRVLGASEILDRAETSEPPPKPLLSERWAACVDAVGGSTLVRALAELRYGGALAACGNAGGNDCQISVLPLILRAVRVLGVDTVMLPAERRPAVWSRIAELVDPDVLESITSEIELADLPAAGRAILEGSVRGRTVVRLP
jgi:acrylyl-CoA reductase (NADPH)